MRFVFRMAWRETRAAWRRLLFFFVCVAMGVAAIVVIRSVVQNVRITLTSEARSLIGADVVVQGITPWTGALETQLDSLLDEPDVLGRTDVIETQTMAAPLEGQGTGNVRLVELRGVGDQFPFYGAPELASGQPYSHALLQNHGVVVEPELLTVLGLKVGDQMRLAGQAFTIRDAVTKDHVQRASGIGFGPRVYMDIDDLRHTTLLGYGSRATYQVLLRTNETTINAFTAKLRRAFRKDTVTVRSWRGVEDRLGENLTIAENYLSLVGFAIVVLGGIGVWSVTRVLVQQKVKSVAVLKCVGATSRQVLATYVLQVAWLAAAGSVLGVGMAIAAASSIPYKWLEPIGLTRVGVTPSAAVQGVAVGMLVSVLFALVPLLEMRRVKPLLLLRADTASTARQRDWQSWLATVAMGASLALVAMWQADSIRAGLYVTAGLAGAGLVLLIASRLLIRAVAPLTKSKGFALRHAVVSLGRPGNQTRVILMSVGIGCFFILGVRALQTNLIAEFNAQMSGSQPDLVLIDIQPDQVDGVKAAAKPYVREAPRVWPLMRARVVGVEGKQVNLPTADDVRKEGSLTREYGVTYRPDLQENERVTAGTFWNGPQTEDKRADGTDTEVSIEELVHADPKLGLGDVIRFNIAGYQLKARVTSIRKVTWDEAQNGGFVFVLRPAPAVERAPHSFVGFVEVNDTPDAAGGLERDLVKGFPNVSAIDVRAVLASIREVVDNATLGVTVVGAVTLVGGVLILIGAVAMTKFQRLYESAIYRTLGASTRMLATMVTIEYSLLGLLAGVLGAGGAAVLSWALATGLFKIDWQPAPGLLLAGVAITTVAVGAIGLIASAEVLVKKPLGTLRSE